MRMLRRGGVRRALYVAWLLLGLAFLYEQYRIVSVWRTSPVPIPLDPLGLSLGTAISLIFVHVGCGAWTERRSRRWLARWLPVIVVPFIVLSMVIYARTLTLVQMVLMACVVGFASLSAVSMVGESESGDANPRPP